MTYSELLASNPNLITANITDTLKETISDWCGDLEVGDEDKFQNQFNRILKRDYPRYCERLRVDVRDADNAPRYDWMVGNYLEREIDTTGSTTHSTSTEGSTTQTGTSGSTVTNSGTDTRSTAGTASRTPNLTTETTIAGGETNIRSGSEDANRTVNNGARSSSQGTLRNQGVRVVRSGSPETMDSNYSSNRSATKTGPMDAGVASTGTETLPSTNNFTMGTIENVTPSFSSHASAIGQTAATDKRLHQEKIDSTDTTTYTGTTPDQVTNSQAAVTDTDNLKTTYNSVTDKKTFDERVDTQKQTGTESSETTGSETQNFGHIITTEGNSGQSGTSKQSGEETGSNSGNTKERLTGRQEAPADIMRRAVEFIEGSNAWEWLYPRLLVCFQAILEV